MARLSESSGYDSPPLVDLSGICVSFGSLRAVDGVDLVIRDGSIHAIVGENGAGKSTLGKVISGLVTPDRGAVKVRGVEVSLPGPRAALRHGVAAIAQELTIVDSLTVEQNVFLGREPRTGGVIRRSGLHSRYEELASETGFELPGRQIAGSLRIAEKQQVEILRALASAADLIVMDEPTASLSEEETRRLHAVISRLATSGRAVLLISHFLDEVLALADHVTVLRDGRLVRTTAVAEETRESLILGMLGRPLQSAYPAKEVATPEASVVLSVRGLSAPGVTDATFEVRAGEIVGLAGLVGAGRTELALALAGASARSTGDVSVDGRSITGRSIHDARRAGIVLITESRKEQGLLPSRSVTENITIAGLASLSTFGVVRRTREGAAAQALLERVTVRRDAVALPVSALSGGNQQKVLLARALHCKPRVLIADEPTKGVDVGARRSIYEILGQLAAGGAAVLIISSELEEIIQVAHRVLVLRGGSIVASLGGDELDEERILSAAFRGHQASPNSSSGNHDGNHDQ